MDLSFFFDGLSSWHISSGKQGWYYGSRALTPLFRRFDSVILNPLQAPNKYYCVLGCEGAFSDIGNACKCITCKIECKL